jgi:endogenous inhibitor of DNA gyrase (YacG/DUF329 family)
MGKSAIVKCATCGRETGFFSDPVGPFCSKRCQMIDLGNWLNEEYRITEPLRDDHVVEHGGGMSAELDQPEEN